MDEATIVKALLDHNIVLGRIEEMCKSTQNLQLIANGRTGKLEERVTSIEKENDNRLVDLETAKKVADGQLRIVKWIGSIAIFVIGVVEPWLLKFWK